MAALGRNILTAVLTAFLLGAPAPVLAESAIENLASANKTFRDGDPAKALEQVSEIFSKEKMDNDTTAKALLLRGEIYEKLGKPALAYADYNNAVWLGGLTSAERNRANEGSQRTQSSLGVGGDSAQTSHGGSHTSAAAPSSSNSFLGGLFGGDSLEQPKQEAAKTPPPAKAPEAAPAKKAEPAPAPAAPGAGARKTATASQPPQTAPAAAETSDDKSYYSQFAAVQDETKALTEAKRLAGKLRDSLGGRPVLVIRTEAAGGKPALYRVVTGPLANKSEAGQLCASLKTKGANCMVYAP